MENSPPYEGGEARSAGVVRNAETYTRLDHPVCAFGAATPPASGGEYLPQVRIMYV
jgi:hypothetical protein